MTTTPAEYASLNVGDVFTWTCHKCGKEQTGIKVFDSLPAWDAQCEECQTARKMTKHVYIIKHATPNSSTEYAVMTESEAKTFFGGGVLGFSASMLNRISHENYSEMNVPQSILDQLK